MMQYKLMGKWVLAVVVAVVAWGCQKESQADKDDRLIVEYLTANGRTAEKHSSDVYYHIDVPGTGSNPDTRNTVRVKYKGYLTDNRVFDEATTAVEFPLTSVIKGWQIGIPLFNRGAKGTLYIPSRLGYGTRVVGSIPANSVLIFDIELIDFF